MKKKLNIKPRKYQDGGKIKPKDSRLKVEEESWLDKLDNVLSAPQRAAVYALTGKYQNPSEALGIKNKWGKMATDLVLDPVNLLGVGIVGKISKSFKVLDEMKDGTKVARALTSADKPIDWIVKGKKYTKNLDDVAHNKKALEDYKKLKDFNKNKEYASILDRNQIYERMSEIVEETTKGARRFKKVGSGVAITNDLITQKGQAQEKFGKIDKNKKYYNQQEAAKYLKTNPKAQFEGVGGTLELLNPIPKKQGSTINKKLVQKTKNTPLIKPKDSQTSVQDLELKKPFVPETYMMPDGNKYDYNELLQQFPEMKNQKVFNKNFPKKMKSGGFLKSLSDIGQNTGIALADTLLAPVGAGTVLDNSYTDTGLGKGFRGVTDVTGKVVETGAQVAATAFGGPAAGMAVGQLQKTVGGLTQDPNAELRGTQVAGNVVGDVAGVAGNFYAPKGGGFDFPAIKKHGGLIKPFMMKYGGQVPAARTRINIEGKELMSDAEGNITRDFQKFPKHPKYGIDPEGTIEAPEGQFIIPKNKADAFKGGDRLRRSTILLNLINKDKVEQETKDQEMIKDSTKLGKAVGSYMKKGGQIKKYGEGDFIPYRKPVGPLAELGPEIDLNPYNRGSQFLNAALNYPNDFNALGVFKQTLSPNQGTSPTSNFTPFNKPVNSLKLDLSRPGMNTPSSFGLPVKKGFDTSDQAINTRVQNNNYGSYKTPNTQDPFKFNGMDALSLGLNNLGPASYLLGQGKRYDKVDYGQVNPDLVDPREELLAADIENNMLNRDISNASGGNSGTYLSNRQAGSSRNLMTKAKIIRDYSNTNNGIKNQFKQFNQQNKIRAMEAEAGNKGQALSNYYKAIGNIGSNTAQGVNDIQKRKMDEKRMKLYSDAFPNFDFSPEEYAFLYKNRNNK